VAVGAGGVVAVTVVEAPAVVAVGATGAVVGVSAIASVVGVSLAGAVVAVSAAGAVVAVSAAGTVVGVVVVPPQAANMLVSSITMKDIEIVRRKFCFIAIYFLLLDFSCQTFARALSL
jgi:hypothetical protein